MKESDYPGEIIFFSAIAGTVASLAKSLVHHTFEWLGRAPNFYNQLTAYLTHGHYHVKGFGEWIFSVFGDMVFGALFAMILGYWLKSSRAKYHWWIGTGFGFGIWFISLVFGNIFKIIKPNLTSPLSLFAHLAAMITYGLMFILICRFWKPLRERIEMGDDHGNQKK